MSPSARLKSRLGAEYAFLKRCLHWAAIEPALGWLPERNPLLEGLPSLRESSYEGKPEGEGGPSLHHSTHVSNTR
jgi:hypothetical protein